MSYLVYARKWRPQVFEDVVGQDHVTATLKNAILSDRVAHAYLFSGPRGVGKTTTARVFAKALNCQVSDKPVVMPCNKCESCIEITEGRSLDVIEIDGASNRGIDEIRQLRENVKFAPSKGRYKVYIIDEVHQITADGFNALLKTLEEPPAYVKFIFATTHKHKIIPTIISRCQRFDFKKVSTQELVDKLKDISAKEKLTINEEALFLIARAADGSVRDAESLLDQVASFSDQKVRTEDVVSMLGSVEQEIFFQAAQMIIDKNSDKSLQLINKFINDGKDLFQFTGGLMEHFRNLAVAKVQKDPAGLIDLPKDVVEKILSQSKKIELADVIYCFNVLNNAQELMRKSGLARIQLEIAMIKLVYRDSQKAKQQVQTQAVYRPAVAVAVKTVVAPEPPRTVSRNVTDNNTVVNYVASPMEDTNVAIAVEEKPVIEGRIITIEDVQSAWQYVLNGVKSEKISAALFLMEGMPSRMEGVSVVVDFPQQYIFYKEALERNENRCIIEKYLKSALNSDIRVKFVIVDGIVEKPKQEESLAPKADVIAPVQLKAQEKKVLQQNHTEPIVESAVEIFRARIIRKD